MKCVVTMRKNDYINMNLHAECRGLSDSAWNQRDMILATKALNAIYSAGHKIGKPTFTVGRWFLYFFFYGASLKAFVCKIGVNYWYSGRLF